MIDLAPIQISLDLEAAMHEYIAKLGIRILSDMPHVAQIFQLGPLSYGIGAGAAAPYDPGERIDAESIWHRQVHESILVQQSSYERYGFQKVDTKMFENLAEHYALELSYHLGRGGARPLHIELRDFNAEYSLHVAKSVGIQIHAYAFDFRVSLPHEVFKNEGCAADIQARENS